MTRDSQSVALELIDIVRRTAANHDLCRQLLAVKLEVIYDFAYALGYKAGKDFTREHAYDLGFADGSHLVQQAALPAIAAHASNTEQYSERPSATTGKRRVLRGLPCEVCGALYVDNKCPICSVRQARAVE